MQTTIRRRRRHGWLNTVLGVFVVLLAGCDEEPEIPVSVPSEFVGVWEAGRYGKDENYVYLQITADGNLAYARIEKSGGRSSCTSIGGSQVDAITDTEISTTVLWMFDTDYEINERPAPFGDTSRMTIDGQVLTRTDSRKGGFDYSWECDGDLIRRRAH